MPPTEIILKAAVTAEELITRTPALSKLAVEAGEALARAANPVSKALAEHGFPRAAALLSESTETAISRSGAEQLQALGDIKIARLLNPEMNAGMTIEEFQARTEKAALGDEPLRVKQIGSTQGWHIAEEPLGNRQVGQVGTMGGYIPGHGDLHWVAHTDGTFAPYRIHEELEPLAIKPTIPQDTNFELTKSMREIPDLSVGNILRAGRTEEGKAVMGTKADWRPSDAGYWADSTRSGSKWFYADKLQAAENQFLVNRLGAPSLTDPRSAEIGETIRFTDTAQASHLGDYKITSREDFTPPVRQLYGDLTVSRIDPNEIHLSQPTMFQPGKTSHFVVPTDSLRGPMFHRIEPINVKAGDKLIAPVDGVAPNRDDWQYSGNMRGQQWSVEATAPNGILLKHADGRSVAVPQTYMNTGTFMPLDIAK